MRALIAVLLLAAAVPAHAHSVGLSRGEYRLDASGTVTAALTFARPEALTAAPALDADHDGAISAAELQAGAPLLDAAFVQRVTATAGGLSCPGRFTGAALTEQDGLSVEAAYACADGTAAVTLRLGFLEEVSLGHRHLASLAAAGTVEQKVAYEDSPVVTLGTTGPVAPPSAAATAVPLFRLGILHILSGWDHLLFLFGLIVVGGRLRQHIGVLTAFTVAHSITLGLAVLGVWAPSPRIIEPAIALSIAYVGVENFFVRDVRHRWLITFPFGLVHGFGFAGALQEIALPHGQVPVALASFNAGVEAGQLAVLCLLLPAVLWLGRQEWFAVRGVRGLSAAIAAAGVCCFVVRIAA